MSATAVAQRPARLSRHRFAERDEPDGECRWCGRREPAHPSGGPVLVITAQPARQRGGFTEQTTDAARARARVESAYRYHQALTVTTRRGALVAEVKRSGGAWRRWVDDAALPEAAP